jgi:hypothetical protein
MACREVRSASVSGTLSFIRGVVAAATFAVFAYPCTVTAADVAVEYKVKAVCLFNFAKFIEWPPEVLEGTDVLNLCIVGTDPFGELLDAVSSREVVGGRKLVISRHAGVSSEVKSCHVLYYERTSVDEAKLLKTLGSLPVVTVGDGEESASLFFFFLEAGKVRFNINHTRAKELGLKISSQLLKLAVVR